MRDALGEPAIRRPSRRTWNANPLPPEDDGGAASEDDAARGLEGDASDVRLDLLTDARAGVEVGRRLRGESEKGAHVAEVAGDVLGGPLPTFLLGEPLEDVLSGCGLDPWRNRS